MQNLSRITNDVTCTFFLFSFCRLIQFSLSAADWINTRKKLKAQNFDRIKTFWVITFSIASHKKKKNRKDPLRNGKVSYFSRTLTNTEWIRFALINNDIGEDDFTFVVSKIAFSNPMCSTVIQRFNLIFIWALTTYNREGLVRFPEALFRSQI